MRSRRLNYLKGTTNIEQGEQILQKEDFLQE